MSHSLQPPLRRKQTEPTVKQKQTKRRCLLHFNTLSRLSGFTRTLALLT
jgi:hypothetical protein